LKSSQLQLTTRAQQRNRDEISTLTFPLLMKKTTSSRNNWLFVVLNNSRGIALLVADSMDIPGIMIEFSAIFDK